MEKDSMELARFLEDTRTSKRRSAAKALRKRRAVEAGPHLLSALQAEMQDHRQWETQYQMIMALGETGYLESLVYLKNLANMQHSNNAIPCALGDAIARLSFLKFGNLEWHKNVIETVADVWFVHGVLRALVILKLRLDDELVEAVMNFATSDSSDDEALVWVAAILVEHDNPRRSNFLEGCKNSSNQQLIRSATAAEERRHLKWDPF